MIVNSNIIFKPSHVISESDCDWPMFGRTPDGNRVAPDECGLKGDGVKLKWKWEPYIGQITTDLVLDNGNIYAGSATGKMYCIEESTRLKKWEFQIGGGIQRSPIGEQNSPATSNGKVYFGTGDGKLYCLDAANGTKVWEYQTGGSIQNSPAISNGKVYFGSNDHKLYCLDASTGAKVWEYETGYSIFITPSISNGKVYLYCSPLTPGLG
jgi:outer membrane protein assembly factor BamB